MAETYDPLEISIPPRISPLNNFCHSETPELKEEASDGPPVSFAIISILRCLVRAAPGPPLHPHAQTAGSTGKVRGGHHRGLSTPQAPAAKSLTMSSWLAPKMNWLPRTRVFFFFPPPPKGKTPASRSCAMSRLVGLNPGCIITEPAHRCLDDPQIEKVFQRLSDTKAEQIYAPNTAGHDRSSPPSRPNHAI